MSGEGKADRNFLKYLHAIYCHKSKRNHCITIHQNNNEGHTGGSSVDTIVETMCACDGREYDNLVVLLDGDITKGKTSQALLSGGRAKVSKRVSSSIPKNCGCIIVSPCLEAMLLGIVEQNPPDTTPSCKGAFSKHFGKDADKLTEADLTKFFPKELLDLARKRVTPLDRLVSFLLLEGHTHSVKEWFKMC